MRWFSFLPALLFMGLSISLCTAASAIITIGTLDGDVETGAFDVVDGLIYAVSATKRPCSPCLLFLVITDVSDPENPVGLSALELDYSAHHVVVADGFGYLASPNALRIVDVSNPHAPIEVGELLLPEDSIEGYIVGFDVEGSTAWASVLCWHRYCDPVAYLLLGIDVSDPAAPVEVGRLLQSADPSAFGIDVAGGFAYVGEIGRYPEFEAAVRIFDVSNPAAPVVAGRFVLEGPVTPRDVEVIDGIAYVAGEADFLRGTGALWIGDVSIPSSPVDVGSLELPGRAKEISVSGGLAYVREMSAGIRALDISDPAAPKALGSLGVYGAGHIEVAGAVAYVESEIGLRILDVSKPTVPVAVGGFEGPSTGEDVEVVGNLAYVADGHSGLRIIDVSDPEAPFDLGALGTPDSAQDVEVVGGVAYVADARSGLRIVDVSDSAAPFELAALDTPDSAQDVEVVGGVAYVADARAGLRIVDVTDPTAPFEIGALDTTGIAQDVEVVGSLAYVADSARLRVIDVSNPAEPIEIAEVRAGQANSIAVVDGLAYVGDAYAFNPGLRIFDVSDPAAPFEIGSAHVRVPGPGSLYHLSDVEVRDGFAYLAEGWLLSGVRVFDVSDPTAPTEVGGFHYGDDSPRAIEFANGLAYLVGGSPGLQIVDFGPEYTGTIEVDLDIKPGSDPNSINPDDGGVVPAAILGSESFDVADVDVTTLAFGPGGAAPAHCHGPHIEDVNGDGFADLLAHYSTAEAGIAFGTLVACVEGATLAGKPFNGCDAVRTVPDMDGDRLLDTEEATLGTNPLSRDSDGDGFTDGNEVLVLRTDPLNAHDPKRVQTKQGRGGRRRH